MIWRYLLAFFMGLLLAYFGTAFVVWEPNPQFWSADQRLAMIILSLVLIVPSMIFISVFHEGRSIFDSAYLPPELFGPLEADEE